MNIQPARLPVLIFAAALMMTLCPDVTVRAQDEGPPIRTRRTDNQPGDPAMEATRRINVGDPSVIPVIMKWLDQALVTPDHFELHNEIFTAIRGAREFRLEEAGPTLVGIYQNPRSPREVKDAVADAAAIIGSPKARRFLQMVARDPELRPRSRLQVFAALITLGGDGADAARKELFEAYRQCVSTRPNLDLDVSVAPYVVGSVKDPALLQQLKDFRQTQRELDSLQQLDETIQRMTINASPPAEQLKIAQETDWPSGKIRRIAALDALAEDGSPDALPAIQQLAPWTNVPFNQVEQAQRQLSGGQQRAAGRIRRRCWRELSGAAGAGHIAPTSAPRRVSGHP